MFSLRIGALTVILSDMLVKGFTTGAAVHVLMSQVKSLFGLKLPRHSGPGKLIKVGGRPRQCECPSRWDPPAPAPGHFYRTRAVLDGARPAVTSPLSANQAARYTATAARHVIRRQPRAPPPARPLITR